MSSVSTSHCRISYELLCNNVYLLYLQGNGKCKIIFGYCMYYCGTYVFWCTGVCTGWFVVYLKPGYIKQTNQYIHLYTEKHYIIMQWKGWHGTRNASRMPYQSNERCSYAFLDFKTMFRALNVLLFESLVKHLTS